MAAGFCKPVVAMHRLICPKNKIFCRNSLTRIFHKDFRAFTYEGIGPRNIFANHVYIYKKIIEYFIGELMGFCYVCFAMFVVFCLKTVETTIEKKESAGIR